MDCDRINSSSLWSTAGICPSISTCMIVWISCLFPDYLTYEKIRVLPSEHRTFLSFILLCKVHLSYYFAVNYRTILFSEDLMHLQNNQIYIYMCVCIYIYIYIYISEYFVHEHNEKQNRCKKVCIAVSTAVHSREGSPH